MEKIIFQAKVNIKRISIILMLTCILPLISFAGVDNNSVATNTPNAVNLELSIKATIIGASTGPIAIIEDDKSGESAFYRVGDSIENALIKEISQRKVVFLLNKETIILNLQPKFGKEYKVAITKQNMKKSTVNIFMNPKEEDTQKPRNKPQIKSLVSESGRFKGIRIVEIPEDSLLYLMGLRMDDTILSIDGEFFQNKIYAEKAFLSGLNGSYIIYFIERNENYIEIQLSIN
ncbi:MAG: hypothetical protein HQK76_09360 [Desulfobacterales bacterium]|nr:hypothetical protein [Desulfobacterales bacterium]